MRRASWRFWMATGSVDSVRAMVFNWAILRRSMDDDQRLRGISGVVETPEGDLWLNAVSGIFHIGKAEISEALKDSAYRVKGEHFGIREGLSGVATQSRPFPTAIEGTDGRLWFALRNGVVWLDPAAYSEKRTAPPPI